MPSPPDAVILCGGAGLRLRSVTGVGPKVMAGVGGRPFLELLLRQLRRNGFERAILAVGYQKDAIRSHFGEQAFGLHLAYAAEDIPLGTGGALRNAVDLARSETVLVMNGDSYIDVDLRTLTAEHLRAKADLTVVVAEADERADCGFVLVDRDGRLTGFAEKQRVRHASYLNAGVYVAARRLLSEIPLGNEVSLERELVPTWLGQGRRIQAFVCTSSCVDIGTPDRYLAAQAILATAEAELSTPQTGGRK